MKRIDILKTIKKIIQNIENENVRREVAKRIPEISLLSKPEELNELLDVFMRYPEGMETAKNLWPVIYSHSGDSPSTIKYLSRNPEAKEDILKSIKFLVRYGVYSDASDIVRELSMLEGSRPFIAEEFETLFEECNRNQESLVLLLLDTDLGREKLKKNFEKIKDKFFPTGFSGRVNPKGFFDVIKALKDVPGFEKEYEDYSYWAKLYDEISIDKPPRVSMSQIPRLTYSEQKRIIGLNDAIHTKDVEFANLMLSEDRDEKKIILQTVSNGQKYNYLSCGSSSFIIQAGDQIVKLGIGRRKFNIPYHPRIMMPYFRKKYKDGSCLEVFNFGVVDSAEITDEKLLEIYKELESAGIIWGDARKDNLLVLTKDNEVPDFIQSSDFNIFGFLEDERYPTNNHVALKKGDIVICDLDMLYVKGDPDYQEGYLDDIIEDYKSKKSAEKLFGED